nr:hypothetical protein [Tanacetum cinerariifolium]
MAFVSSPRSTNEVNTAYRVNTANTQVSPASTKVSTASTQDSTTNLTDATVYTFLSYMADDEVPTNMALIAFSDFEGYPWSIKGSLRQSLSSESDVSMPTSPVYDRYKSGERYHVIPPPYTRTFMPPKPDLVFHDALIVNETVPTAFKGNPQHALKDKGVIDSGCSRHMTENMSYLSNFEEINGGYVAFGGNRKGGKITDTECIVLSSDFKLPDENHLLLKVPSEKNMYNVDLKNNVPLLYFTSLFAKATLDEYNL